MKTKLIAATLVAIVSTTAHADAGRCDRFASGYDRFMCMNTTNYGVPCMRRSRQIIVIYTRGPSNARFGRGSRMIYVGR